MLTISTANRFNRPRQNNGTCTAIRLSTGEWGARQPPDDPGTQWPESAKQNRDQKSGEGVFPPVVTPTSSKAAPAETPQVTVEKIAEFGTCRPCVLVEHKPPVQLHRQFPPQGDVLPVRTDRSSQVLQDFRFDRRAHAPAE